MSKGSRLDRLKTSQIFSLDFRRNLTLALPGTMGSHLYLKDTSTIASETAHWNLASQGVFRRDSADCPPMWIWPS